jgi:hypothetical protein
LLLDLLDERHWTMSMTMMLLLLLYLRLDQPDQR